ncbi:hypothetical protein AALP_AA5G216100 [Arabis alpina]|uniref:F-box domain-containing protein n=1 Tax=Arabis alpina TaxID=50452 RepID=A0A087GYK6_ARAAL|nr:hypothetical protein AALP_AA5G216100 [Arabis alpina]
MEEQREESDCRKPMEEVVAGKGLGLSSKAQTLVANTVEVLDSGVCDTHENSNGGTMDGFTDNSVSDKKQVKVDVTIEPETKISKMECEEVDGTVEVKLIDEIESCDDVQRVSTTVELVEVETNGEIAKSEVKSHESAGEEENQEIVTSSRNEETDDKVKYEVDNTGACDDETLSVADDKADQGKESAKKSQEDCNKMDVDSQQANESADSIIFFPNTNQKAINDLQNSMKRGADMRPLPTDLIIEIFLRLPAKSVGRFRSVSKQWCSMLSRPDFIELFLSRSCARPRLLFAVERKGVWRFFSSPQSSSSRLVDADFHSTLSEDVGRFTCSYAFGLFYFRDMWIPRNGTFYVVYNPTTGQYVTLPNVNMFRKSRGFLGFDPSQKQFKVLAEGNPFDREREPHEVLTLGTGELSWRKKKIDCPQYDHSLCEGICINGVLYYLVVNIRDLPDALICFDLKSEEFKLVVAECFSDRKTTKLINYKGKLGGINCSYGEAGGKYTLELRMCVLEDVERQEWSTYVYTLPENELIDDPSNVSVAGVIATGEIVLAMDYTCKPYYVFYFNPEKNTLQSVEIQGFGAELEAVKYCGRVSAYVDHVEHLDVEDFKNSRVKHQCSSCEGHFHVDDSKPLESIANQVKHLCSNCEEQEKKERQ